MSFKKGKKSKCIYPVFYLMHIFTISVLFIYFCRFELLSLVISSHPEGFLLVFFVRQVCLQRSSLDLINLEMFSVHLHS